MGFSLAKFLRPGARFALLLLELAIFSGLIAATRCANYADVFVGGQVYFVDADCYARMTRARLVAAHPGLVVRHHDFENFPAGTTPHTTAPLDYLIVGLAGLLGPFSAQALDLAGALISPLLALAGGWFLWWWSRRAKLRFRWVALLLFALSPILAHGTALGRPDHQALLLVLLLVALAAEWILKEEASRGWGMVSGLSWGLAGWVSRYEPAVFLAIVLLSERSKLFRAHRRPGWLAGGGVLLLAAVIERRWPQLPAPELHDFFLRWSATIGELRHVGLTNPSWWQWFGGFSLLAPLLLIIAAVKRKTPSATFAMLLVVAGALTIWQARWGYFLGVILCLTIPALVAFVRPRWLGTVLAVLAFAPFLSAWDAELWPNEQTQSQRGDARREAVAWRAAAATLHGPFLAPWWLAPSAAYWSGQPSVAGSSHESLPGIVASARFYLATSPNDAAEILLAHGVRAVLAYDAARTAQNSAAILGVPVSPQALCFALDRAPSQAPRFLTLVGEDSAAKIYRINP
ncbi:MAG: hypothetical protein ACR2NX_11505 [Chthoniobacterales bacterium]